jgi:hypothetical protein
MEYPDGDKQIQISNAPMIEEYPAASCRESPGKDVIYWIRSLTPQQATGNALAVSVQT